MGLPGPVQGLSFLIVVRNGFVDDFSGRAIDETARVCVGHGHDVPPIQTIVAARVQGQPELSGARSLMESATGRNKPLHLKAHRAVKGHGVDARTAMNDLSWAIAAREDPTLDRTSLAARTTYPSIRSASPVGIKYTAGLDAELAAFLQSISAETLHDCCGR